MQTSAADKPRLELPEPAPIDVAREPAAKGEISLLDLLIVIGENKVFLAASTLVVAAVTAIVTLILPTWYAATTVILPPQQNSSMSGALLAQVGNLGGMGSLLGGSLGIKNPADLTIALLKSRTVEDALVQRFGLMKLYKAKRLSDARKSLENHTTIEAGLKDGLVRISVETRDAKQSAEMANAYVEEYKKLSASMVVSEASQRRAFFEHEAKIALDDLSTAEQGLKQTQESTGLLALEPQSKAMLEGLAALRARVDAQEVLVRSLRSFATDQNRDLVMAEQQLATMREQLSRAERGQGSGAGGSVTDMPIEKIPAAGLEYLRKLREVKYREALFELLVKQYEIARLDESRQGAVIQVVDTAVEPDRRSFPRRTIIVLGATFAWLLLAICWVFFQGVTKAPEDRNRLQTLKAVWRSGII
ncbi:MAG TPA: Wzz/FepE/Etk N-terminal domain-containing protein [Candidatus Angelobacter sp.]|nr:Wzz/FepE/Etk N-terminal domain-containing protein [Candidatus Angelobacter sp.]